jgi:NADPH:quinone reductase-like Zn-dependent oxidoreductase
MPRVKAALLERYAPTGVRVTDVPKPPLGPGDVLVEVHAASINPVDFKIRDGKLKQVLALRLPIVMGNDLSGVIVEVGSGVKEAKVGDAVYARVNKDRLGAFAEYAAVREIDLAPKPTNLDHVKAASVPLVALTAWQGLRDRGHLSAGQKVLIHAGSGGVGTIAIQLAKHWGATVATTCSDKNTDLVKSLGADIVVDYRKQRFEDVVHDADVVLDTLGGADMERSFQSLRQGGILVTVSGPPDPKFAKEWGMNPIVRLAVRALSSKVRRIARKHGATYDFLFMSPSGTQLREIAALIEAGTLQPVIDRTFSLDQVNEALAYSESGRARGKVVVAIRA